MEVTWKEISAIRRNSALCIVTFSCTSQAIVNTVDYCLLFIFSKHKKQIHVLVTLVTLRTFPFQKCFVSKLIPAKSGLSEGVRRQISYAVILRVPFLKEN